MTAINHLAGNISRRSFLSAAGIAALTLSTAGLFGCAGGQSAGDASGDSRKKITVAYALNGKPTSYSDDSNKPAGYEVDVVNAVAEILSDKYEFTFEGVDQIAVFAGLASGKYDQGLTNSFWTPERAEKYLQPGEAVGATLLGILIKKENSDIASLEDAAKKGLKLAPIAAGDGNYYVVQDYNEQHPDNQIDLQATDDANAFVEAFDWVAQGRYDMHVIPLQYYNELVVSEDGSYHKYIDDLAFIVIGATKTWSFMTKGDEEYASDWDTAIKQLQDSGKLEELSRKWYSGINNFAFLGDAGQTYSYLDKGVLVDPTDESVLTER